MVNYTWALKGSHILTVGLVYVLYGCLDPLGSRCVVGVMGLRDEALWRDC